MFFVLFAAGFLVGVISTIFALDFGHRRRRFLDEIPRGPAEWRTSPTSVRPPLLTSDDIIRRAMRRRSATPYVEAVEVVTAELRDFEPRSPRSMS